MPPKDMVCSVCQHRGSEVRFQGCGCNLHARCVPLSLIIGVADPCQPAMEGVPPPVELNSLSCPVCKNGVVTGMYLYPLSLDLLDRAVEIRKEHTRAAARSSEAGAPNANGKRQRDFDSDFSGVQAESSYLILSHTGTSPASSMSTETDIHRTGRWTSEEIRYVDFLLNAFDRGLINLPHGIKLNEFLGDVLLCKSSRLTKKMKNAKLSARSYKLRPLEPNGEMLDHALMSKLEEEFLHSISSESTQLELLFNLAKLWRTNFSNLCLQVGYKFLDASDWASSLDAMEHRALEAEDLIRKSRRERMNLALKTDARCSNPGVFFSEVPVHGCANDTILPRSVSESPRLVSVSSLTKAIAPCSQSVSSAEESEADFIVNMMQLSAQTGPDGKRNRLMSMDLIGEGEFDDLLNSTEASLLAKNEPKSFDPGLFLQKVVLFLEGNHLPFEHVDIWLPSYVSKNIQGNSQSEEELRLYHAGYATRSDINPTLVANYNEFGEYSKKFSFALGVGLPGRVYESSEPDWSMRVHESDPKYFERAGGARIYGLRTVLGIPVDSSIGKIVVALYTSADLKRNDILIQKCMAMLCDYASEPKWRLDSEDLGLRGRGRFDSTECVAFGQGDFDYSEAFDEDLGNARKCSTIGCPSSSVASATASITEFDVASEEQQIATLLGEYMPLSQVSSSSGESSVSSNADPVFLQEFMQLRLLLLRPRSKRAPTDNELIDTLRSSFHGYTRDNKRAGCELATLLVKDWRFLKGTSVVPETASHPAKRSTVILKNTYAASATASEPTNRSRGYSSHIMDAPSNVSTYSARGAPMSSFNFPQPPDGESLGSFDSNSGSTAQSGAYRRISDISQIPD